MNMKTIIFIMTILFFTNCSSAYSWTYRSTKNGGEKGYSSVTFKKTGEDNRNTITIATGIGFEVAPTVTNESEQTAMNYALKKISNGVLKGTWKDRKNNKTVVWKSTDKTGRTSTIEIVGVDEIIPESVKTEKIPTKPKF